MCRLLKRCHCYHWADGWPKGSTATKIAREAKENRLRVVGSLGGAGEPPWWFSVYCFFIRFLDHLRPTKIPKTNGSHQIPLLFYWRTCSTTETGAQPVDDNGCSKHLTKQHLIQHSLAPATHHDDALPCFIHRSVGCCCCSGRPALLFPPAPCRLTEQGISML